MFLALSGNRDCGLRGGVFHRQAGVDDPQPAHGAAATGLCGPARDERGLPELSCGQRAGGEPSPTVQLQAAGCAGRHDAAVAASV